AIPKNGSQPTAVEPSAPRFPTTHIVVDGNDAHTASADPRSRNGPQARVLRMTTRRRRRRPAPASLEHSPQITTDHHGSTAPANLPSAERPIGAARPCRSAIANGGRPTH